MSHDIFISYSRKDIAAVKAIKEELEKLGLSCWMDLTGIVSGTRRFSRTLIDAIKNSGTLLFFLSADSQRSEWAIKEIDYAAEKKKNVVLVRFNDDPMTEEFLFDFGRTDIIDWRVPEQKEKLFRDLAGWAGFQRTGTGRNGENASPTVSAVTNPIPVASAAARAFPSRVESFSAISGDDDFPPPSPAVTEASPPRVLGEKRESALRTFSQIRHSRWVNMQSFLKKGELVLNDNSLTPEERHAQARQAFGTALRIAQEIGCSKGELDDIQGKLNAIPDGGDDGTWSGSGDR
ncbi:MAG: toll/interleukin-1 receptor domain-containing protein [Kiritimatiellae bacterium]|nr:toll/interleukin-1 receptor domain-containing protein [Kiritimatiellia bacterium]